MAVDANETRRQRVLDALANLSDRTWTRTVGGNTFAFTIANPQLRVLNDTRVFSVDVTVTRNGVTLYDDRINMPNPAVAIKAADGTVTDSPLQALRDTLLDVVNAVTRGGRAARLQRNLDGSFQGDTLAVRAATTDGSVSSTNATFATMATGSSLSADTAANSVTLRWSWTGATYQGRMAFEEYDTSSLGAGATISAAVHTLYGNTTAETDSADNYNIDIRYKDWGGSVTTADWFDPRSGVWNGLDAGGILDNGSWDQVAGHANNFSDSGVYTSISTTGTTRVVVGYSGMNASTPANINEVNFRTADATGTTSDPLLTITYSAAVNASITGVTGAATATGIAGSVTAQVKATVTGVTGAATAAGNAGTVTAVQIANVTGVTGSASAAGIAGSVAAQVQIAVTGVTAEATADGIAGSVSTGFAANITGVTGEATADGIAGTVSTVNIVNITGVTASADAAGIAGTVTAGIQIAISGETATATADANAGSVTAQLQISVVGVTGAATAAGVAGTVNSVEIVSLIGATATATATGIAGAAIVATAIVGVAATATAIGIAGIVHITYPNASGTISDARAYSATLSDAFAYGGSSSDARIRGGTVADDYAYGGVLTDARTSGGSISDG